MAKVRKRKRSSTLNPSEDASPALKKEHSSATKRRIGKSVGERSDAKHPESETKDLGSMSFDQLLAEGFDDEVPPAGGSDKTGAKKRKKVTPAKEVDVDNSSDDAEEHEELETDDEAHESEGGLDTEVSDFEDEEDDLDVGLSLKSHKEQLEKLKSVDPDFYAYLQKHGKNLLDFGDGEEEEEDEDDEDEGDGEEDASHVLDDTSDAGTVGTVERSDDGQIVVTSELLKKTLESAFEKQTLRGLKRIAQIYRSAAYMGGTSDVLSRLGLTQGIGGRKKAKGKDREGKGRVNPEEDPVMRPILLKYKIPTSTLFMDTVVGVMQNIGPTLALHMGTRAGKSQEGVVPAPGVDLDEYPGWDKKVKPIVKGLLSCTVHLLNQVSEESLQLLILRSSRALIPYLQQFGSLTRKWSRALLEILSSTPHDGVRLVAYLRLRQMAVALPYPMLDTALKGAYLSFVRAAKFVTESNLPSLGLMTTCLAELYGLDEAVSYSHAFIYLRQLALHLRTALTTRSKQSVSAVLSWQYVNCLRAWTAILCRHATDSSRPLFPLVYPLVQIIFGVMRLQATARYSPLMVHCCSMLIEISWVTNAYVPVMTHLLEILRMPALTKKPKGGAPTNPPNLNLMVKVGNTTLETRAFQDIIINRVLDLLLDACKASYTSVAFPEIVAPVVIQLRQWAKETRGSAWRSRARALVSALTAQASKVAAIRATLSVAPKDKVAMATFMATERAQLRDERMRAHETEAKDAFATAQEKANRTEEEGRAMELAHKSGLHTDADDGDDDDSDSDSETFASDGDSEGSGDVADDDNEDGSEEDEEEANERTVQNTVAKVRKKHHKLPKGGPADSVADLDLSDLE